MGKRRKVNLEIIELLKQNPQGLTDKEIKKRLKLQCKTDAYLGANDLVYEDKNDEGKTIYISCRGWN